MLIDKSLSMSFLPTAVSWTYERDFLPHNDRLHHHLHSGMHIHSSAAVPAHTSSLEPPDWPRMHEHAWYPCSHCRIEQLHRPDDLPVSTGGMRMSISDVVQTPCEAVTSNKDAGQAEVGADVTSCSQPTPLHSRNTEALLRRVVL